MKKILTSLLLCAVFLFSQQTSFSKGCGKFVILLNTNHYSFFSHSNVRVDTTFNDSDTIHLDVSFFLTGCCGIGESSLYQNGNLLDSSANSSYTLTDTGVYLIGFTGYNGCDGISESFYGNLTISIQRNVGLITNTALQENANRDNHPLIFPTLSTGKFNIRNTLQNLRKIYLTDYTGKSVLSLSGCQTEIDISELADGVYFYSIEEKEDVFHRGKIVKVSF